MKFARVSNGYGYATARIQGGVAYPCEDWRTGDPARDSFVPPTLDPASAQNAAAIPLSELSFLPPIGGSNKLICLGLNYRDHVSEVGNENVSPYPSLFTKFPDTMVGAGSPIVRPTVSDAFDYEGEIAIVIGKGGRHIRKSEALSHLFGFTILMDGSVRDYQGHSVTAGKCFYASGSVGPWIVTSDEIPDYRKLTLKTRLNGEEVQSSVVENMIYDIPTAIEYISRWTPLAPGDVISTGTPAGVGFARTPQLYIKPGDLVEVEVSSIGVLANTAVAEA
ncbi:5-oxopent-3-ene-1,2,5-tricarboxylate decarboxylase [Altererythrobacter salegens]|uniref:5-oxopent-3-ene-1,2,5-tricarboxylate decarboxylase n=1 Tax=Croceibacterium salegens TaxID=1737568 RepID=A0A6I4SX43_9SPHN|nr:fumarylacetoacetate hydrolase family protein [Croceibacterium salegens]MXO60654.1 5-oxopent-3-ene-1,2,5-tricarboxylate decarboxylase [Croceibacterium salegens]